MENRNDIVNELSLISPLIAGSDPAFQGFTVESGYFEGLADNVLRRIRAEEARTAAEEIAFLSPLLGTLEKKTPFDVPDGYFEELSTEFIGRVSGLVLLSHEKGAAGEKVEAPFLLELRSRDIYRVPTGYFEDLPASLLHAAKNQSKPAVVIPLTHKRNSWLKYAAAAIVLGFLLTGAEIFFKPFSGSKNPDPINSGLAKVTDQEIVNYLENQNMTLNESLNNTVAAADNNDNDENDLLNAIPDEELQQYLDDHAARKDPVNN